MMIFLRFKKTFVFRYCFTIYRRGLGRLGGFSAKLLHAQGLRDQTPYCKPVRSFRSAGLASAVSRIRALKALSRRAFADDRQGKREKEVD